MKFNYLIKASPFLFTLLLLIFLGFSNNKQNTKLRILIWETPSFSLGTYLAISSGTGFILSYFITSGIAKSYQKNNMLSLKYRDEIYDKDFNNHENLSANLSYDNTLIERDIKDPSPTINANFRIIGKRKKSDLHNTSINNAQYANSIGCEDQYDLHSDENEEVNQVEQFSTDWNDESYSRW